MNPPALPDQKGFPPPLSDPGFRQPAWPKVIGIIAIVIAGYGLFANGMGLFASQVMGSIFKAGVPQSGFMEEMMPRMAKYTLVNSIGCLVLACLLMAAGIVLLYRRPPARGLFLLWAVSRIGFAAYTAPLMMDYMSSIMDIAAKMPATSTVAPPASPSPGVAVSPAPAAAPPMPVSMTDIMKTMSKVGTIMTMAMMCVLPLFILIWFNLGKVKAYIATWPLSNERERGAGNRF
jgi:hypothetical protein